MRDLCGLYRYDERGQSRGVGELDRVMGIDVKPLSGRRDSSGKEERKYIQYNKYAHHYLPHFVPNAQNTSPKENHQSPRGVHAQTQGQPLRDG